MTSTTAPTIGYVTCYGGVEPVIIVGPARGTNMLETKRSADQARCTIIAAYMIFDTEAEAIASREAIANRTPAENGAIAQMCRDQGYGVGRYTGD